MGPWLLFFRSNWELIALGALVLACYYFHHDAAMARAELKVVVAQNEAALAKQAQKNAVDTLADVKFNQTEKEKFNGQKVALTTALDVTARELRDVRARLASGGTRAQPIRVAAGFCDSPGAGDRLSAGIQKAQRGIEDVARATEAAIVDYQIGAGERLVAAGQVKQLEALNCRAFALRGAAVNAVKSP